MLFSKPRLLALALALAAALLLASLLPSYLEARSAAAPSGASVSVTVAVPASMRGAPFDVPRTLAVPPNFAIAVYARVPGARFMALAPNGDLLVSQPSSGSVLLVRPKAQGDPAISTFVSGLRKPHDIVFHTIGATTYVYIAETHQINRFVYVAGDLAAHDRQVVVANLPDSSTPELKGAYGHELKNIALDGNHKLYVSIASTCNACINDTTANPVRGAIYQYNADGSGARLFARGIRNAEGLAFLPGSNELWVVINNRDNIRNPATGQIETAYVDDHPPEEFTRVRDGGNYGWPFCNPNHEGASGYADMPFDRDMDFNADGHVDCGAMDRIAQGIQAHSAPLGLSFLQGSAFAAPYRSGAIAALHGSWNRSKKTGYKLAYFPWNATTNRPNPQLDLVTGWADDTNSWGRPVDTAVAPDGGLFISDDASGAIYKLTYTAPAAVSKGWLPLARR